MDSPRNLDLPQSCFDSVVAYRPEPRRPWLFVGNHEETCWLSAYGLGQYPFKRCVFSDIGNHINPAFQPDLILSLPVNKGFDCIDLAQYLDQIGFCGRQRILNVDLPSPRIICAEVKQICPDLDFGILDPAELLELRI